MKKNLFVDMDGVLAVYDENVVELMYNEGFFLGRPAIKPMLKVVKKAIQSGNFNVYILTSVIDSPFCIPEKAKWLDKYLPELPKENRLYVPYGVVKSEFAKEHSDFKGHKNILIDDYTENLNKWNLEGAIPVKVLNGINSSNGTWLNSGGEYIDAYSSVNENFSKLVRLAHSI